MDAIKKIITTGKPKRSSAKPTNMIMDIGTPTDVKREHHVEHTEDGLVGLPEEFQRLLPHMLTKEELTDGKAKKAGIDVLLWNMKHQDKTNQMKTINTYSHDSSDELEPRKSESTCFYVKTPVETSSTDLPDIDNEPNPEMPKSSKSPALDNDPLKNEPNANNTGSPVPLRRNKPGNKSQKAPRLRKSMTEDEVMNEIRDLCEIGHPLDRYDTDIELGAGAAGTVFLALNKETKERVAIKKIDMVKQQKKEMILMEIKVRKTISDIYSV